MTYSQSWCEILNKHWLFIFIQLVNQPIMAQENNRTVSELIIPIWPCAEAAFWHISICREGDLSLRGATCHSPDYTSFLFHNNILSQITWNISKFGENSNKTLFYIHTAMHENLHFLIWPYKSSILGIPYFILPFSTTWTVWCVSLLW